MHKSNVNICIVTLDNFVNFKIRRHDETNKQTIEQVIERCEVSQASDLRYELRLRLTLLRV